MEADEVTRLQKQTNEGLLLVVLWDAEMYKCYA